MVADPLVGEKVVAADARLRDLQNQRRPHAAERVLDARRHDHTLLRALEQGDILGFWDEARRVQDRFNVCGFSALACLLELFPGYTGRILDYDFWQEEPTQSAVSFAAVLMTGGASPGAVHD